MITLKRILILLLCAACFSFCATAQTWNKDSLLGLLKIAKEDTATVRLLLNIEKLYSNKNYDSFYYYLAKADTLTKKIKSDKFDFFINAGYAEYYYYHNDYKKSIAYAQNSKDIAQGQKDDKLLAKSYNNLAAIYNHFEQHRNAIDCILKCLDITEKTKDSISFPVRNLTASNTYFNLKQFDKSILFAKKAIEFGKKFNNAFAVSMGLGNMSASYSQMNNLDSSISISKQQLNYAKEQEDVVNTNYALINLCYDNYRIGDTRSLDYFTRELIRNSTEYADNRITSQVHNVIALNFMTKKDYIHAKQQLDSGIVIAKAEEDADAFQNLYKTYSTLYFLQGKIKEGENYFYRYDSIITATGIKELNFYTEDLETKYQTEKKEAQIKIQQSQLKQKSILNYLLTAGAASLLIISLLLYRNYKSRQKLQLAKIEELEAEKQLTATTAVLKGEEQERTRLAKDLHDGLGGMLSGLKFSLSNMKENLIMTPDNALAFERSIDMLNSSINEMRRVAHNMMPEILVKYGLDKALQEFCFAISQSGAIQAGYQSIGMNHAELEQTTSITVYRIIQELVNNAIKHAQAKNILVQLHYAAAEKNLSITVEDDGKGFYTMTLKQAAGMGWRNIDNRVQLLKGTIDVQSAPGKGTSIMIEMPI